VSKVRWGILGTSKFAQTKFIPAMKHCRSGEIAALASRDLAGARAAADRLGIAKAYGSYEELLADANVDAIYNPLPNHLHVPWSIKALAAGKHVLCEKPVGLSSAEAGQLLSAAKLRPHLKVMEAFMYRHHPQWRRAKQLVDEGAIGQLRTIQSFFSYFNTDAANIRNRADVGGGGLMDIGCYNVSLSSFIFGEEPRRVIGCLEYDPDFGTDRLASGILVFEHGTATFTCSTQLSPHQRVNILGTEGRVEIEIPFNAPPDRPCRLWHQRGAGVEEITFDICDQYTIECDLMSEAILNDTPVPTPLADAVANMEVIEAIVRSGRDRAWAAISPQKS
jgi:predicted dehydrogenase